MESTHIYFYKLKLCTKCSSPYKVLNLQAFSIPIEDGKYSQTSGVVYHQQFQL